MGIIIFLGDSITDAERKSSPNQLGYGYVEFRKKLEYCKPGGRRLYY